MAAPPPAGKRRKLTRSTLRRLTAIPPHKVRHDNRHFPMVAPGGGISYQGLDEDTTSSEVEVVEESSANDRRKAFLTMANLKRVFRALDLSDDGFIDAEELHEAQTKIGGRLSREEVEDIIWEVDDDRDGKLSMEDYLSTYHRAQVSMPSPPSALAPPPVARGARWRPHQPSRHVPSPLLQPVRFARMPRPPPPRSNPLQLVGSPHCPPADTQADTDGFEPRRFYSIVEFLLMDRDCSGEISLDEAMTTLFERQGADNLADVTAKFFRAAGIAEGVSDPPPGAMITFGAYYQKVGCARPRVPTFTDLRRLYSSKLRLEEGRGEAPRLRPSTSVGVLPRLLQPRHPPVMQRSPSAHGLRGLDSGRPKSVLAKTAPPLGGTRPKTVGSASTPSLTRHSSSSRALRPSLGEVRRAPSGGLVPLKPITATGELATSALVQLGKSSPEQIDATKMRAAGALGVAHARSGDHDGPVSLSSGGTASREGGHTVGAPSPPQRGCSPAGQGSHGQRAVLA